MVEHTSHQTFQRSLKEKQSTMEDRQGGGKGLWGAGEVAPPVLGEFSVRPQHFLMSVVRVENPVIATTQKATVTDSCWSQAGCIGYFLLHLETPAGISLLQTPSC